MVKLLGIDYGTKRVGIALSDDTGTLAFPCEVVANDKMLVSRVAALCAKEHIKSIVLGESKNFKGEPNTIMGELVTFKGHLGKKVSVPIVFEEEFMTTSAVRHSGAGGDMIDAQAAALILQRYLDKQQG